MFLVKKLALSTLCLLTLGLQTAQAHYPWLEIQNAGSDKPVLQCYFGDAPTADDPKYLSYVSKAKFWQIPGRGEPAEIELTLTEQDLHRELTVGRLDSLYAMHQDLGTRNRDGKTFWIRYYSKTGPAVTSGLWRGDKTTSLLNLDVKPAIENGELVVTVLFRNEPAVGAEISLFSELAPLEEKLVTNDKGVARFALSQKPIQAVRARFVEPVSGERDGKAYDEVRHFTTVTFPELSYHALKTNTPYAEIPEQVTSFGAAVDNGKLYIYGGHTGSAHSYSDQEQGNTLWSLDLNNGKEWKALGTGPRIQGLALVADEGKLYRIGGFTAKNKEGEKHDLWSLSNFARFDPQTNEWTELAALPEPRSSFDAAVLDHKIYVVGGWSLQGKMSGEWLETAWVYDLKADQPQWTEIAKPNFQRRALSVAAHNGKIYALGGMQSSGGPTTKVAVYDPQTGEWSEGPQLIGGGMTGFGSAAFAVNGDLYCSTYDGTFQKLVDDGKRWQLQGNLENARFFHRMVPTGPQSLVFIGGANMQVGKFETLEVLNVTE